MDKNILIYHKKETNVLIFYDEQGNKAIKLTRDITPQGIENLHLTAYDGEDEVAWYPDLWFNPKKKKKSENPKHTGGKKPYLSLMIDSIEELRTKGIKNVEELIGYVACLGKFIEWNTGKLVQNKRNKKALQYNDLLEIYKCSKPKLNKMIKLMKDNDLLIHTKEGYFVSPKYIRKGKKKGVLENDQ